MIATFAIASCLLAFADDAYVYHQATGRLTLDGREVATGYSGKGAAKNDPAKEKDKGQGPIPAGLCAIGEPRTYNGMKHCFDLTPRGHDAHGRTEFQIHGDSRLEPGTASAGCIILPPAARQEIAVGKVRLLRVVKE